MKALRRLFDSEATHSKFESKSESKFETEEKFTNQNIFDDLYQHLKFKMQGCIEKMTYEHDCLNQYIIGEALAEEMMTHPLSPNYKQVLTSKIYYSSLYEALESQVEKFFNQYFDNQDLEENKKKFNFDGIKVKLGYEFNFFEVTENAKQKTQTFLANLIADDEKFNEFLLDTVRKITEEKYDQEKAKLLIEEMREIAQKPFQPDQLKKLTDAYEKLDCDVFYCALRDSSLPTLKQMRSRLPYTRSDNNLHELMAYQLKEQMKGLTSIIQNQPVNVFKLFTPKDDRWKSRSVAELKKYLAEKHAVPQPVDQRVRGFR